MSLEIWFKDSKLSLDRIEWVGLLLTSLTISILNVILRVSRRKNPNIPSGSFFLCFLWNVCGYAPEISHLARCWWNIIYLKRFPCVEDMTASRKNSFWVGSTRQKKQQQQRKTGKGRGQNQANSFLSLQISFWINHGFQ